MNNKIITLKNDKIRDSADSFKGDKQIFKDKQKQNIQAPIFHNLMKLTIKQAKSYHQPNSESPITFDFSPFSFIYDSLCGCRLPPPKVVFRVKNQHQRLFIETIKIDIVNNLNRVYHQHLESQNIPINLSTQKTKQYELFQFIYLTTQRLQYEYNIGFGYLCTHVFCNQDNNQQRYRTIEEFIKKFGIYFKTDRIKQSQYSKHKSYSIYQQALSQQTLQRINQYTNNIDANPSNINPHHIGFDQIQKFYQKTLLLEFVPSKYSLFIIFELINRGIEEYIRLVVSLIHFTLNTRNTINEQHFTEVLLNPYMGTIQWPIVIANRQNFDRKHS